MFADELEQAARGHELCDELATHQQSRLRTGFAMLDDDESLHRITLAGEVGKSLATSTRVKKQRGRGHRI